MHVTGFIGVAIGLLGIGVAVHGIATGSITFVFARLFHGWGPTLSADFDREERPVLFWASVLLYGLGGLMVALGAGWTVWR